MKNRDFDIVPQQIPVSILTLGDYFSHYDYEGAHVYKVLSIVSTSRNNYLLQCKSVETGRIYTNSRRGDKKLYRAINKYLPDPKPQKKTKKDTTMNNANLNSVISMAQAKRNMFVTAIAQFEEGGKEYHFKLPTTLKSVIKAGDYAVAENANGSWRMAVVKIKEVRDNSQLPYDLHGGPWAWIVSKVALNAFTIMKENEDRAMANLRNTAAQDRILSESGLSIDSAANALDDIDPS